MSWSRNVSVSRTAVNSLESFTCSIFKAHWKSDPISRKGGHKGSEGNVPYGTPRKGLRAKVFIKHVYTTGMFVLHLLFFNEKVAQVLQVRLFQHCFSPSKVFTFYKLFSCWCEISIVFFIGNTDSFDLIRKVGTEEMS